MILKCPQFFLIIVFTLLALAGCNREKECPSRYINVDNECVCLPKYFGESCEFEDECLTSFKECNGYPCEESRCMCPDIRRGSGCEKWSYSEINGLVGAYHVVNWQGVRYFNLQLDSLILYSTVLSDSFIRRNWRPVFTMDNENAGLTYGADVCSWDTLQNPYMTFDEGALRIGSGAYQFGHYISLGDRDYVDLNVLLESITNFDGSYHLKMKGIAKWVHFYDGVRPVYSTVATDSISFDMIKAH